MIENFKHKGLRLFFESDNPSKLQAHHVEKIRRILYRLDEARSIEETGYNWLESASTERQLKRLLVH